MVLLVRKLFSAVPSAAQGVKARVVYVWNQVKVSSLRTLTLTAALPQICSHCEGSRQSCFWDYSNEHCPAPPFPPALYGNSVQFISSLGCRCSFSYLLLINIKSTSELLLSKGGIPTQIEWKILTDSTGVEFCCNFLYPSTLCIY